MLTTREQTALRRVRAKDWSDVSGINNRSIMPTVDCGVLAEAMVREFPADDAEPFTPEMLVGATKPSASMAWDGTLALELPDGRCFEVPVPVGSTAGDVRRFLAWQGVAAKTRNSEPEGS